MDKKGFTDLLVSFSYLLIQFEALWSSRPGGFNIFYPLTTHRNTAMLMSRVDVRAEPVLVTPLSGSMAIVCQSL